MNSSKKTAIIVGVLFIVGTVAGSLSLEKHNQALALGYVVFRGALETVASIVFVSSLLLLIPLGQEYVKAGAPDAASFRALGTWLLQADFQINPISKIVFSLGAHVLLCVVSIKTHSSMVIGLGTCWSHIAFSIRLASHV